MASKKIKKKTTDNKRIDDGVKFEFFEDIVKTLIKAGKTNTPMFKDLKLLLKHAKKKKSLTKKEILDIIMNGGELN